MKIFQLFSYISTLLATSQVPDLHIPNQIHLHQPLDLHIPNQIHFLQPLSGTRRQNISGWEIVPEECANYVGHYMLGQHNINLAEDGKEIWVFDVDEATLSNLPYYTTSYNSTEFNEWTEEGKAPALLESLELYKKLLSLGIKIVFLTGRSEHRRNATTTNLNNVGYHTWEKLILNDLFGANTSNWTFKLPHPMYYISLILTITIIRELNYYCKT
ncbi:hypothetical protein ACOSQ2_020668 [Xanthoceras sorbifolium]